MRRTILVLGASTAATLLVLLMMAPAGAITNGVPDGDGHPNVGTIIWKVYPDWEPNDGPFWDWASSGSLLAPRVYLTAAHSVDQMERYLDRGILDADEIYVTFDTDLHRDPDAGPFGGIHPDEENLIRVVSGMSMSGSPAPRRPATSTWRCCTSPRKPRASSRSTCPARTS